MTNRKTLADPQQQTISALQNNRDDELIEKLVEIAGAYKEVLTQATAGRDGEPVIAKIKQALEDAVGSRELDRADQLLDALEKVQDADLESRQLERASTAAQRGQIAIEQLRYCDAARHFADAARHVPGERIDLRLGYRSQKPGIHANLILTPAIERYRMLLVLLSHLADSSAAPARRVYDDPREPSVPGPRRL
jgi:hypothetical protein